MQAKTVSPSDMITSALPTAVRPSVLATGERAHPLIYLALSVYALLVALTIHWHEPWADEAQSWLLGRDSSLMHLWGTLLHYEGTPGLWQTLLHGLIRLGLPYAAYNYVSAILSLAAVYLLVRYAPLPLFIRLLLPFTYYLCYQYAVIARSYALIAPLLFAIAAIYPQIPRRPALATLLLCLLAGVSVHGFLLSTSIWVTYYGLAILHASPADRKQLVSGAFLFWASTYWAILVFLLVCAWPAKDVAFAEHRGLANLHFIGDVTQFGLSGAFIGYWIPSLLVLAFSAPLLWRGGGWLFFLLSTTGFCLFGAIVYTQLWHFGVVFLAWIFAIWISAQRTRVTGPTVMALIAAIAFQCYWTGAAMVYDWNHPYSGSLAAAQYLRGTLGSSGAAGGGIYAVGFSTTAIQPYFASNIFSNFREGSFWDWSHRNKANDRSALFESTQRQLVLVGYKVPPEKEYWADLLALLGYDRVRQFDGGTFWQTHVFEFESYDLYRDTGHLRAASRVHVADPSQAPQLLDGFYAIEDQKSRWATKKFSVLLKVPAGFDRDGAQLMLQFYLPDVLLHALGPITMKASISGQDLPARTFSKPGVDAYSVPVPAASLHSGLAEVEFSLDKSAIGLGGDARELGVIVTDVGFAPLSPAR
jgi:hypothetical protein